MSLMGFALSAVATPAGFLVLLSAVLLLFFFMSSSAGKRTGKGSIPGPFQLPFFGNLFEFMRNQHRFDDWLVDLKNQYGDTFQLSLPFKPIFVVTTNPKNVEHILKTNFQNYEKGPFFRSTLHDLLGNGIFNSDGDMWRPQRKITSNLFNVKHFREGMIHVFVDHSKMALDIIEKSPQDLDVSDLFYRYTLDSIGCIAFGKDIKSLDIKSLENPEVTERFFTFSQTLRKLMPVEREIAQDVKAMNKFADEILTARKKENQESLAERFDLLSLFMSRKDESGAEFDDAYLRDMILNMVIAGRDTTAQSLAWTCYLLAQHPEAREKAKEEVDNVLGKDGVIDYDNLKQMEYLQAVVSESLRLYPSVPRDPHTCGVSDVLPTQHHVEAGSLVFYFSYGMGRSKEIWGEDCMEFKPERFYENPELATNTFTFTAFQGGPRTCLGQKMAYLEEKTILAMIFQKYDFELVPNQDVKIQLSLTLPMVNGLRLKFIPRG